MGEDFGKQGPRDGAECHGVARDGSHDKGDHQHTRHSHKVAGSEDGVDDAETSCSDEHQRPASPFLDGVEGNEGEEHIGDAGDDDVDEHAIDVEARTHENLLCIIENHIGTAPLLEDSDD